MDTHFRHVQSWVSSPDLHARLRACVRGSIQIAVISGKRPYTHASVHMSAHMSRSAAVGLARRTRALGRQPRQNALLVELMAYIVMAYIVMAYIVYSQLAVVMAKAVAVAAAVWLARMTCLEMSNEDSKTARLFRRRGVGVGGGCRRDTGARRRSRRRRSRGDTRRKHHLQPTRLFPAFFFLGEDSGAVHATPCISFANAPAAAERVRRARTGLRGSLFRASGVKPVGTSPTFSCSAVTSSKLMASRSA